MFSCAGQPLRRERGRLQPLARGGEGRPVGRSEFPLPVLRQ